MTNDSVQAYESHAHEFTRCRSPSIGGDVVDRWARSLAPGADVLELACGSGVPVTAALVGAGVTVSAIDASPTLVAEFASRFPDVPVRCQRVQDGDWYDRSFAAVICIGLIFLLEEADQLALIERVAAVLEPGGRFLFTAPVELGTWDDILTGHPCRSLGVDRYRAALESAGFEVIDTLVDSGGNNHYDAIRP
ncbi:MAG: class I SAM-dependent methyltransferase [Pseudomonadota bacterium]